jgi:hypothetical protein
MSELTPEAHEALRESADRMADLLRAHHAAQKAVEKLIAETLRPISDARYEAAQK